MDHLTAYEEDIYAWSREQASVLRDLMSRRDLPNALDLGNVAEEIDDLGNSRRTQVESFLRLIFVHLLKAASSGSEGPRLHWRSEVTTFHIELVTRYTRSMSKDIDLERIWKLALRQANSALRDYGEALPPALRTACPYELDELLADELDPDALSARLVTRVSQGDSGLRG